MTDRAMPAAASYEDIYQTSSSSVSSVASSSSYLPADYMMFADSPLDSQRSLKGGSSSRRSYHNNQHHNYKDRHQLNLKQNHHHHHHPINAQYNKQQQRQQLQQSHSLKVYQLAHPYLTSSYYHSDAVDIDSIMVLYDDLSTSSAPEVLSMTPPTHQQHYLTIEELKSSRNSCWLCGCNWQQDHVSLDCPECGGYALTRPCPSCDGKCKQVWKRNINGTHDHHKALWVGQCTMHNNNSGQIIDGEESQHAPTKTTITPPNIANNTTPTTTSSQTILAQSASSCCSSHPSSAASSDSESDTGLPAENQQTTPKSQQKQHTKGRHHHHMCVCN